MKKFLLLGACVLLFAQACKKDNNKPDNSQVIIQPDPVEAAPVTGVTQPSSENMVYRTLNLRLGYNKHIFLDANNDGTVDLSFSGTLIFHDGKQHLYLSGYTKSTSGNKFFIQKGPEQVINAQWAYPFNKDEVIEPTEANQVAFTALQQKAFIMSVVTTNAQTDLEGLWKNKQDKYLGFALKMNGEPHFGWLRLSHDTATNEIIVIEYAYSKVPGEDVIAGQK
ncbi:hypothetical protein [Mucilaginibacter pedocola]|uniref:Lipoprotein n=1 Tax=Mucilaginibacter pedocola TaxID=1792845 RepID=A0A1S9PHP1_9SPHI|nr:hypothetical protein [Mucilaginibacter pedocola]OOQ60474.1 hypothetical protein BC343_24575 [Mucilaginibacter pedocola]